MLHLKEVKKEDNIKFSWGQKIRTKDCSKDAQLFSSFTYNGVDYFLDDVVCLMGDGDPYPHIGKLVKVWETSSKQKKVKVVWFFHPSEIQHWLKDIQLLKNEIFLASGEGRGLFNINPLEAICGKCNVICISKDKRNPKASEVELRSAEYVFYRTFDVGSCRISEYFPNKIAETKVECFFNSEKGRKHVTPPRLKTKLKEEPETSVRNIDVVTGTKNATKDSKYSICLDPVAKGALVGRCLSTSLNVQVLSEISLLLDSTELKISDATSSKQTCFSSENTKQKPKPSFGKAARDEVSFSQVKEREKVKCSEDLSTRSVPDLRPLKKRKLEEFSGSLNYEAQFVDPKAAVSENRDLSKRNYLEKTSYICHEAAADLKLDMGVKTKTPSVEVTKRPDVDTSKWFKPQSWEDRIQRASEKGTLILLENLDPSFTSSEVKDIVWHAFNEKVDAKMLQLSTFSSEHCGKAFVIFHSKNAADFAISELKRKCLMLPNGRPVVAHSWTLRDPVKPAKFCGHLMINKVRLQKQREDMRKAAVSTSHYSQPNTIEWDMAVEWRALQAKSDMWWKALNEQQAKEIKDVRSRFHTK